MKADAVRRRDGVTDQLRLVDRNEPVLRLERCIRTDVAVTDQFRVSNFSRGVAPPPPGGVANSIKRGDIARVNGSDVRWVGQS